MVRGRSFRIIPPGGTDDQDLILTGDVLSIEMAPFGRFRKFCGCNRRKRTAHGDGANISGWKVLQTVKWPNGCCLGQWVAGTDEVGGGGGSSLWSEDASGISRMTGHVGIGHQSSGDARLFIQNTLADVRNESGCRFLIMDINLLLPLLPKLGVVEIITPSAYDRMQGPKQQLLPGPLEVILVLRNG
ncbi:hypothetical protein Q2T40_04585 [Winogradskyella maritima]|nr:hypothetical protein [Winogradskyella maritima]